jgi:signal transduction histidine kinase
MGDPAAPLARPGAAPVPAAGADSAFDLGAVERALAAQRSPRPRRRSSPLLLAAWLGAALLVLAVVRTLAAAPTLDAVWQAGPQGTLTLRSAAEPALHALRGRTLRALALADGSELAVDVGLLRRPPRWIVDDAARAEQAAQAGQLAAALAQPRLELVFEDGQRLAVSPVARGVGGLGPLFWLLAALAVLLVGSAGAVLGARPQARNALYAVMALCQAANLLLIATLSVPGIGQPAALAGVAWLPVALDLATAAAAVHAFALHPYRLPGALRVALPAWSFVAALSLLAATGRLPALWWWAQGGVIGLGVLAIGVLTRSYRVQRHPLANVLRRFAVLTIATLALATLAVTASQGEPAAAQGLAALGAMAWTVLFAALLLLVPLLARSRQAVRELVLLAAIGIAATALGLLLLTVRGAGDLTVLLLTTLATLLVYAAARPWLLSSMVGSYPLSTERTFEQLYQAARELQQHPARHVELLSRLLRGLFEPGELLPLPSAPSRTRVVGDGAALLVPLRGAADGRPDNAVAPEAGAVAPRALLLRHAREGRRLFTPEDARLADRIVEQLRRAVAYDQAVERGRREERLRIAQDLHDDIGARLLTLMYQAPNPEMEDYLRHTLQDLKTLTRGLAAGEHRLSHAAAEWKRDLAQRLGPRGMVLGWRFDFDDDLALSVVQWSGLTRVLRELVSNTIAHAQATRVDIVCSVQRGALTLTVADDGTGRDPASWTHGLGLGGVRKRVKQLGGDVSWRENRPQGITCEVHIADLRRRP